jgi:hypothetical protein
MDHTSLTCTGHSISKFRKKIHTLSTIIIFNTVFLLLQCNLSKTRLTQLYHLNTTADRILIQQIQHADSKGVLMMVYNTQK